MIFSFHIDYILVRKRFRNCIKQCKTYPGADIGSDHTPLIAEQCQESSEPEKKWQQLKESINYANESAPKLERKTKKVWMTEEILTKMEERKKAKSTSAYKPKNKEIQKLCKKRKRCMVQQ